MEIILIGVNHKTAPVALREQVAVIEPHLPQVLQALRSSGPVRECVVLSTCNRTEVYCVGPRGGHAAEAVVRFLATRHGLPQEDLLPHVYHRFNADAARHLFTVASGLDSMILGEGQILAQVRTAFHVASAAQGRQPRCSPASSRRPSTRASARARETRIAQGASSVSFAAVELARRIHGNLHGRPVLVLGTGKMGMLTARLLVTAGVGSLTLLSRTRNSEPRRPCRPSQGQVQTRAAGHGSPGGGTGSRRHRHLVHRRSRCPVITEKPGGPHPAPPQVPLALHRRHRRATGRGGGGQRSRLGLPLQRGRPVRRRGRAHGRSAPGSGEGPAASWSEEVDEFTRYFASLEAVPAIRHLRETRSSTSGPGRWPTCWLDQELSSEAERNRLEAFSRSLVNRLLHLPTVRLKELATTRNLHDGLHLLMEVFDAHGDAPSVGTRHSQAPVQEDATLPEPAHREEGPP